MEAFFQLLQKEEHPAVRAILSHLIFVYIHPYMDGNGRMGRFLMNAMLASGGYPWTIIHVTRRDEYMSALEQASVDKNILPFVSFVASEMQSQNYTQTNRRIGFRRKRKLSRFDDRKQANIAIWTCFRSIKSRGFRYHTHYMNIYGAAGFPRFNSSPWST